jgi:uncharacterized membrane protein
MNNIYLTIFIFTIVYCIINYRAVIQMFEDLIERFKND